MTAVKFIESLLEGYHYITIPLSDIYTWPDTAGLAHIGQVTHRIDIYASPKGIKHYRCTYVGQTGIVIITYLSTGQRTQEVAIPYADPGFKNKLRQITSP